LLEQGRAAEAAEEEEEENVTYDLTLGEDVEDIVGGGAGARPQPLPQRQQQPRAVSHINPEFNAENDTLPKTSCRASVTAMDLRIVGT
jgi:hypothetical protein